MYLTGVVVLPLCILFISLDSVLAIDKVCAVFLTGYWLTHYIVAEQMYILFLV